MKMLNHKLNSLFSILMLSALMLLGGCAPPGGDTTGTDSGKTGNISTTPKSINQAAYVAGTSHYTFGHNSIPNLYIIGAPDDTDGTRWAMLYDGSRYRLYFFKQGTDDTLYQFAYNPASSDYEFGFDSIDVLTITGKPADADAGSIAMLHDGSRYRLYMRSKTVPGKLYQFAYKTGTSTYVYGYSSIAQLSVTGMPADVDFSRWGMLHDGSDYRFYAFKQGSDNTFYQAAWTGSTYAYGYNAIAQLSVQSMPDNSDTSDFAMLHDGSDYRFYFLTK